MLRGMVRHPSNCPIQAHGRLEWATRRRYSTLPWTKPSLRASGINRSGRGGISGVIGMKMVAAVVLGQQSSRLGGISQRKIEVDDSIEGVAGPDPLIYRLALRLLGWRIKARVRRVLKGSERSSANLQALAVRVLNQLLKRASDLRRADLFADGSKISWQSDVIDSLQHDHEPHPWLLQNVAIKAIERARAIPQTVCGSVMQKAIPAEPGVENGFFHSRFRVELIAEVISPAMICVQGRGKAIGDRVSKCHDGETNPGRCDLYTGEKRPAGDGGSCGQLRVSSVVPRGDVSGLKRDRVDGWIGNLAGQVEAYSQLGSCRNIHFHRVAGDGGAGSYGATRRTGKGDRVIGGRRNACPGCAEGHVRFADFERLSSVQVRQCDAKLRAWNAEPNRLPDGLIVK